MELVVASLLLIQNGAPLPAEHQRTVAALSRNLSSELYEEREAASLSVRKLGPKAYKAVCRQALLEPDVEAARRLRHLAGELREARRDALRAELDQTFSDYPELDALRYSQTGVYVACGLQDALQYYIKRRLDEWPWDGEPCTARPDSLGRPYGAYRLATRDWSLDLRDAGVPLWALQAVYLEMWVRDYWFLADVRAAWQHPSWLPLIGRKP